MSKQGWPYSQVNDVVDFRASVALSLALLLNTTTEAMKYQISNLDDFWDFTIMLFWPFSCFIYFTRVACSDSISMAIYRIYLGLLALRNSISWIPRMTKN